MRILTNHIGAWGYLKDKVHSKRIKNKNHIMKRIKQEISLLDKNVLALISNSFVSRLGRMRSVDDAHFELLI